MPAANSSRQGFVRPWTNFPAGLLVCCALLGGPLWSTSILTGQEPAKQAVEKQAVEKQAVEKQAHKSQAVDVGQKVFSIGHSFHVFMPNILADIARAAGRKDHMHLGTSGIGGSRVIQHWEVADDKFKAKALLTAGKVEVLTIAPIYLPDPGIENFATLAVEHRPDIRITLQQNWLPFDRYTPPALRSPGKVDHNAVDLAELSKQHDQYLADLETHAAELNKKLGRDAIVVVPVGQAVMLLRKKIAAGEAPGLKQQNDLFTDDIGHAKPPLQALVGYVHFATTYRQSPMGLPTPAVLGAGKNEAYSPELVRLLQEIAWQAVTEAKLSGVAAK
jgi:hypothetical protein